MKAIISNRIYLDNPGEIITKEIKKKLTYKFIKKGGDKRSNFAAIETVLNYKVLPRGIISIPQCRTDLIPEGYEIVDRRINYEIPYPKPLYELYEEQVKVYNEINDTAIINALVGWGKSYTALWIAWKLGQKALVITHSTTLRDQWIGDIEALFGRKPGVIGSGKMDFEDHFIVVANTQTLVKHVDKVKKEFGLVILDECLDYESTIDTLEYGKKKLGTIVNQKLDCHVLSMNLTSEKVEYKKVLNFYKSKYIECLKIKHSGGGSFKCTGNHKIFTYTTGNVTAIKAEELKVGDFILQTLTNHKSSKIINKEWYPIVLGLILGDGHLRLDNENSNSCRVSITHGEAQLNYLTWKLSVLLNNPTNICKSKSGYNKDRYIYTGTSLSFIDIEGWKVKLYGSSKGSKSKVPSDITSLLTVESWAIMYQDDGSTSNSSESITFSFCELDMDSCNNLIISLKELFNVINPIAFTCNKGFNYIRLNRDDSIKFKTSISSLIHPSMLYKLGSIVPSTFNFNIPNTPLFNESYCVRNIVSIDKSTLTGNNRYNIEVEDNHTYFANGILVSNCHHVPASSFSNILDGMHARYRLGLSGTLIRKDGKQVVFPDYFGTHIVKPPQSNTLTPTIKLVRTNIGLVPDITWAERITKLVEDKDYQNFVAALAKGHMAKGHKVLVIADRVEFLKTIAELVGPRMGLVTGQLGDRDIVKQQVLDGDLDGICGSRQIFAEGISINPLSCVILAVPINNDSLLEQIIGRIQRMHPNKLNPLVLDLQFTGWADRKQNESRIGLYLRKGWEIITV